MATDEQHRWEAEGLEGIRREEPSPIDEPRAVTRDPLEERDAVVERIVGEEQGDVDRAALDGTAR